MEILGLDQGHLGGLFVIICALLLLLPPVQRLVCGPVDEDEPDWWAPFDAARDEAAWRSR